MASVWVVPAFDEFKSGDSGFPLSLEMVTVDQFAFERGKEALAQGIVIGVADGTHRRTHTCLPAAPTELEEVYWLPWSEWWITPNGYRCRMAMSRASRTSSVRR